MSSSSTRSLATNVFDTGNYSTSLLRVESATVASWNSTNSTPLPPPKPLLIGMPSDDAGGEFPVLILLHGYILLNSFYSQLILHVASHGFIVIAPQVSYPN